MTIKQLLKTHFPELGTDEEMNGGDVVMELEELYSSPKAKQKLVPRDKKNGNGIVFAAYSYADISTGYLEVKDQELIMREEAPYHLANMDVLEGEKGSTGALFYLPDIFADMKPELLAFGFSKRFVRIMHALFKQGISYVRFDADGGRVVGMNMYLPPRAGEKCACGNPLGDGEGYDGKCGSCADKAERKASRKKK